MDSRQSLATLSVYPQTVVVTLFDPSDTVHHDPLGIISSIGDLYRQLHCTLLFTHH